MKREQIKVGMVVVLLMPVRRLVLALVVLSSFCVGQESKPADRPGRVPIPLKLQFSYLKAVTTNHDMINKAYDAILQFCWSKKLYPDDGLEVCQNRCKDTEVLAQSGDCLSKEPMRYVCMEGYEHIGGLACGKKNWKKGDACNVPDVVERDGTACVGLQRARETCPDGYYAQAAYRCARGYK